MCDKHRGDFQKLMLVDNIFSETINDFFFFIYFCGSQMS